MAYVAERQESREVYECYIYPYCDKCGSVKLKEEEADPQTLENLLMALGIFAIFAYPLFALVMALPILNKMRQPATLQRKGSKFKCKDCGHTFVHYVPRGVVTEDNWVTNPEPIDVVKHNVLGLTVDEVKARGGKFSLRISFTHTFPLVYIE